MLGCYGGSAPGLHPSCLLVDDRLAIDAGALTSALSLERQARVDQVFITHAHLDHVAQLPFLVDNVFALRRTPVTVLGTSPTLDTLRTHLFNDQLWPDFSRIANDHTELLRWQEVAPGEAVASGDLTLTAFAMTHTVACHGWLLQGPTSAVAVCSDTSSAVGVAAALAGARGLAAIFLEVSFPEASAQVAQASGHLTPSRFASQLKHLPPSVPVFVWHLKPDLRHELEAEIAALQLAHVSLLEQGRSYTF